ncbi:PREDICTED: uncharacterized protein LOC109591068, partial [Amphimedon queenslandica]
MVQHTLGEIYYTLLMNVLAPGPTLKENITLEKMADGVEWSSLFKDGSLPPLDDESKEMKRKRSTLVGGDCGSPSKYSKQSLITNSLEECDTDDDQDINVYLINNNGFIVQK